MLKLGITRVSDLGRPPRWFGRDRHASFLLLEQLASAGHADPAAYDTLIWKVRMPNGTWKQTAAGRLRLADAALLRALHRTHAPGRGLSVLDLGVSTGVTTIDLYEALSECWTVELTATDLYRDAYAVSAPRQRWTVILARGGEVLQHVVGPFVLPGQLEESVAYPVNRALKRWSERVLVPRARAALDADGDADERPYFVPRELLGLAVRRLPFFSWRYLDLMQHDPRVRFVVHDARDPLPGKADVVRAMNLLTLEYFDLATVTRAIQRCLQAVEFGGYFVAGQSRGIDPATMRATVFHVRDGMAIPVERVGGGYELEETVSGLSGLGLGQACEGLSGTTEAPRDVAEPSAAARPGTRRRVRASVVR